MGQVYFIGQVAEKTFLGRFDRGRRPAGATARIAFTTGFADTDSGARLLIEKYHDRRAVARALALASTHSQIATLATASTDHALSSKALWRGEDDRLMACIGFGSPAYR